MFDAIVRNECLSIAMVYGALASVIVTAAVAMFAMMGLVFDHSYSAIPSEAIDLLPSMEGLSQVAGYLDGIGL